MLYKSGNPNGSVSAMISFLSQIEKPSSEKNNQRTKRVCNKLIIPSDLKKNLESALIKNKDAASAEKNYRKKINAKINLTKKMRFEEAERLMKNVSHTMQKVFSGIVPPPPPFPDKKILLACQTMAFNKRGIAHDKTELSPSRVERTKAEIMRSVRSSGQGVFAQLDITPDLLATFIKELRKVAK